MEIIGLILLVVITATVLYYLDLYETGWARGRRFFNIPDKKSVLTEVKERYTEVKQNRIKNKIEKQRQAVSRVREKKGIAEKAMKQYLEQRKQRVQQLVNSTKRPPPPSPPSAPNQLFNAASFVKPTKPPPPPKPIASSSGFTELFYNNTQTVTQAMEASLKAALETALEARTPPKPEPIGTPVLKTLTLRTKTANTIEKSITVERSSGGSINVIRTIEIDRS